MHDILSIRQTPVRRILSSLPMRSFHCKLILKTDTFDLKKDNYTTDPERQIYLSSNKKILVKNDFWTTKSKKNSGDKNFFSEKIWKKQFRKKNFWKNFKSFRLLHHSVIMWYHAKKSRKNPTKSQKRGLATIVQPEPDFSRPCGFREVFGIHDDCSNAKFHQNP